MKNEDKELLNEIVDTNTYDVIWKHLFYQKDDKWFPHTKEIRNERFQEHCEEYCNAMCVDRATLKRIFQVVAEDAEEIKRMLGAYVKRTYKLRDMLNRESEKREMEDVLKKRKGQLNDQHKSILRMLGSFDKAMSSSIVKSWLNTKYTNVDKNSIYQFYNSNEK